MKERGRRILSSNGNEAAGERNRKKITKRAATGFIFEGCNVGLRRRLKEYKGLSPRLPEMGEE